MKFRRLCPLPWACQKGNGESWGWKEIFHCFQIAIDKLNPNRKWEVISKNNVRLSRNFLSVFIHFLCNPSNIRMFNSSFCLQKIFIFNSRESMSLFAHIYQWRELFWWVRLVGLMGDRDLERENEWSISWLVESIYRDRRRSW